MTAPAASAHECTILAIGISSRSVAPASVQRRDHEVDLRFSTTLSTAKPPPASSEMVGDLADGSTASTASKSLGRDVELEQHLLARLERAVEQRHQLAHGVALGVVVVRAGLATTSV